MVLALELHGCHIGPGVGGHLVAPNDLCPPGACRQGGWPVRGGAGWGGGQAGGRQERQRWKEKTLEFAEWGARLPKTWGWDWASCPPPNCSHAGGWGFLGGSLWASGRLGWNTWGSSPGGLMGSVRTAVTVSSRRPQSPTPGPMAVTGRCVPGELSGPHPSQRPGKGKWGCGLWSEAPPATAGSEPAR